jgi:hypothetical protein
MGKGDAMKLQDIVIFALLTLTALLIAGNLVRMFIEQAGAA